MLKIIRASERGYSAYPWMKSYHTFSFGNYVDKRNMHFGKLRLLNDDYVRPGQGFDFHTHQNMEIISIPLDGTIAFKDKDENEILTEVNDVQIMSAGSGIIHTEYNKSDDVEVNFIKIWIYPHQRNIEPRYSHMRFNIENRKNQLQCIVSPDKEDNALWINQQAYLYWTEIDKDKSVEIKRRHDGSGIFVFVIDGNISLLDNEFAKKDAVGICDIDTVNVKSLDNSFLLIIEVPLVE